MSTRKKMWNTCVITDKSYYGISNMDTEYLLFKLRASRKEFGCVIIMLL